eukprot:scpid5981/ scgid7960/ 
MDCIFKFSLYYVIHSFEGMATRRAIVLYSKASAGRPAGSHRATLNCICLPYYVPPPPLFLITSRFSVFAWRLASTAILYLHMNIVHDENIIGSTNITCHQHDCNVYAEMLKKR